MNRAILMGRLVRNPDLKQTQNGTDVTSFTLAVDRRFKSQSGERQTDFIPCVAWGKTAQFVTQYFAQGQRMLVMGSIQPRQWQDAEGNKRTTTEVVVEEVYFADSKRTEGTGYQAVRESVANAVSQPTQAPSYTQNAAPQSGSTNATEFNAASFFPDEEDDTLLPFDI